MSETTPRLERRHWILLAVIVAAAGGVMCIGLGAPFFKSFEGQASMIMLPARNHVEYGLGETGGAILFAPGGLPRGELGGYWHRNHPPLTQVVYGFWFAVTGLSDASGRILTILITLASIPFLFRIAARCFGTEAGLWAALFFATCHLTVWDGRIPNYTPLMMLVMLAFFDVYSAWSRRPTRASWVAVCVLAVLGAMIDWMMYPLVTVAGLHAFWRHRDRGIWRAPLLAILLCGSFAAFYFHLLLATGESPFGYLSSLASNRFTDGSRMLAVWTTVKALPLYLGVAALLAVIAGIAGLRGSDRDSRDAVLMLGAYGVGCILLFVEWVSGQHGFLAAWFFLPVVFVAGAGGAVFACGRLGSPLLRRAVVACLVAAAVGQACFSAWYRHRQDTWYQSDQGIIAVVNAEAGPDDAVATPFRNVLPTLVTYYTDRVVRLGATTPDQIDEARRGRSVVVVWPIVDSAEGFWRQWSAGTREKLGVIAVPEETAKHLSAFPSRVSKGCRIHTLPKLD